MQLLLLKLHDHVAREQLELLVKLLHTFAEAYVVDQQENSRNRQESHSKVDDGDTKDNAKLSYLHHELSLNPFDFWPEALVGSRSL